MQRTRRLAWRVWTFLAGVALMFAWVQYKLYSPSLLAWVLALPPALALARLMPRLRNSRLRDSSGLWTRLIIWLRERGWLPVLTLVLLYPLILFLPMPLLSEMVGGLHWRPAIVESWDNHHHSGKTVCTHVRARVLETPQPVRLSHCLRDRSYYSVPVGASIEVATYESVLGVVLQRRVRTGNAPLIME